MLFQKERQHLYGRIAAGNEAYHEHVTLRIPLINTSLQDTYTRVNRKTNSCESVLLEYLAIHVQVITIQKIFPGSNFSFFQQSTFLYYRVARVFFQFPIFFSPGDCQTAIRKKNY